MPYDFTTAKPYRTGGTDQMYTLADGAASTALTAQGLGVTIALQGVACGFTNGSATVTYGSAASGHDEKILVNDDDMTPYRITSISAGVSFTLNRVYAGTTGTHSTIVFTGPSSGVPSLNPQKAVVGVDP